MEMSGQFRASTALPQVREPLKPTGPHSQFKRFSNKEKGLTNAKKRSTIPVA